MTKRYLVTGKQLQIIKNEVNPVMKEFIDMIREKQFICESQELVKLDLNTCKGCILQRDSGGILE